MSQTNIEQVLKVSLFDNEVPYIPLTICVPLYVKEFRLFKFKIDDQNVWGLHEKTSNMLLSTIIDLFSDKNTYIKNSIVFTNIYDCIEFLQKETYPSILINSVKNYINHCVNLDYIV